MRHVIVLGMSLIALAACQKKEEAAAAGGTDATAAAAPSTPVGPPKLKAGFWTQKIVSDGMTQEIKLCVDEAMAEKMSVVGQQMSSEMCSKNVMTPTLGGWNVESECEMGGMGKVVSKGTITGDMGSSYVMKATSTTTGSSIPQANKTSQMEISAVRAPTCPADMKPGDMLLPGGVKMNFAQMDAMQKRAAGK